MAQNLSHSHFAEYAHGYKAAPDATLRRPQALRITINNGYATFTTTIFNKAIVGRKDASVEVDLDLNRYGARELGLSRQHIALVQSNGTMMVMDLGSRNGTWLNNEKMQISKYYELKHGDELRLGRMKIQVEFITLLAIAHLDTSEISDANHGVSEQRVQETLEVNAIVAQPVHSMKIG